MLADEAAGKDAAMADVVGVVESLQARLQGLQAEDSEPGGHIFLAPLIFVVDLQPRSRLPGLLIGRCVSGR